MLFKAAMYEYLSFEVISLTIQARAPKSWPDISIPPQEEISNIDLEVVNYHVAVRIDAIVSGHLKLTC